MLWDPKCSQPPRVHNTCVFVFKLFNLDNCFNFKALKPCYV